MKIACSLILLLSLDLWALEYIGFTPKNSSQREGLHSILEGGDYKYGIPQSVFELNFARFSKEKLWKLGNIPSPRSRIYRKNFELHYVSEFTRDRKGFKKLPLGLSSFRYKSARLVNTNCFSCHAGVIAGKVIAGMPNYNFDAYAQKVQVNSLVDDDSIIAQAGLGVIKAALSADEWEGFRGFTEYYNNIVGPAVKDSLVKGDNPGPYVVWQTIIKMNNKVELELDLKSSHQFEYLLHRKLPQIQPQPWWNLRFKKKAFWNSDVTHHSPATFALNHLDQHPDNIGTLQRRMEETLKHLEFAKNVPVPKYPWRKQIRESGATRGYDIFNNTCARCHGHHTADGELLEKTYPNIEKINVGTDPEFNNVTSSLYPLYKKTDILFAPYKNAYFTEIPSFFSSEKGYAAPPLAGIWASAPYFHNGSVPTLYDVLRPEQRPKIWQMTLDQYEYNEKNVGLTYRRLSKKSYFLLKNKFDSESVIERNYLTDSSIQFRSIYNTYQFGRKNNGHNFGANLSESEALDLIEFMKLF